MAWHVQAQTGRDASQGKRIALVIGNDAYQKVTRLEKAGNDANAMARELKAAGFEVLLHRDLNYRSMVKAVESLVNGITGGDQVVVFFAGHGVQIKTGSYLLPVDIEASSESEIEKTAYGLNDLMDQLNGAKASFSLIMVDACRDNPMKSKGRSVGMSRGLLPPDPPKGQMVVYSASKGQQALDRLSDDDKNLNGVFTREFITRMKRPGLRIEDLVREVQDAVEELARSVSHEQRPALYNEARGNFYFFGTAPGQMAAKAGGTLAPVPIQSAEAIEQELWGNIKDSRESSVFDEYIRQYPKGRYVGQARVMLAKLNAEAAREKSTRVAATAAPPVAPSPSPAPAATGTSWKIGYIDSARVFARLGSSPQAIEKLNEQIRSLAQQSGFGIIFQEAVYASRAIDITAPLIQALEAGASERSFGAPPPMREGVWKLGYVNATRITERFGSRPDDLGKANQHIQLLAKKFGFGMIFQSAVYASTGIDLTDAVIRSIEGEAVNEHALRTQTPSGYRYAYVDVRRILAELPEAVQAQKQIEQDFKARELELQRRSGQVDDENLKHLKKTLLDDLNARKNREMGAILKKMNQVIKLVAETERYDIIFQELVFVDPQLDITESVLRNAQR